MKGSGKLGHTTYIKTAVSVANYFSVRNLFADTKLDFGVIAVPSMISFAAEVEICCKGRNC